MSVQVMSQVWKGSQHGGSALLMLLAIADFSDDDGKAYPAVATLARKCRIKPRNANYLLRQLQDSGELIVRIGHGPKGCNLYKIDVKGLQSIAGVQGSAGLQSIAGGAAIHCSKPLQPSADKPSLNHQLIIKEKSKKKSAAQTFVLPDWIPEDAWNGYVEMRAKIRAPMTTRAMELKVSELERLRNSGQNVGGVLDKSTSNNWKDVYPLKTESSGKPEPKPWEGAR